MEKNLSNQNFDINDLLSQLRVKGYF
ncbi:hypothetical protein, partial [Anaerofustis stercorihominis]